MAATLNTIKYENAILYLCNTQPNRTLHGKKKLAKLLYYLDFDRFEYEESMETITGDTYTRREMGPLPNRFEEVASRMSDTLTVEPVQQFQGKNATIVYTALAEPDLSVFNDTDLRILKRVAQKYSRLNGRQLENLTHSEAPWVASEDFDTIPFELAFYRGTDFSDAA